MQCIWQWLLRGVLAVSLVLCLAACVLWVWSYWRSGNIFWRHGLDSAWIGIERGHLQLGTVWNTSPSPAGLPHKFGAWSDEAFGPVDASYSMDTDYGIVTHWNRTGFVGYSIRQPNGSLEFSLAVPFGLVTALTALLPVGWAAGRWRLRRRRAKRDGFCVGCGYDLRASPQRCPECGRANV
jgi:4-amino-4-deoxy-L-arabinose transferase-like glycosyltransferase